MTTLLLLLPTSTSRDQFTGTRTTIIVLLVKTYCMQPYYKKNTIKTISDTVASGTYGPVEAEKTGILLPHEPIEVTCANALNMKSISTILLPILTQLPISAQKISTFLEMKNILLSIPTIVDADCEVHLDLKLIKIYKNNKLILQGDQDEVSHMWTIDLVVPRQQQQIQKNQSLHWSERKMLMRC